MVGEWTTEMFDEDFTRGHINQSLATNRLRNGICGTRGHYLNVFEGLTRFLKEIKGIEVDKFPHDLRACPENLWNDKPDIRFGMDLELNEVKMEFPVSTMQQN
jgi:hypothetical protein